MRSYLTRSVFRRLIADRPLVFHRRPPVSHRHLHRPCRPRALVDSNLVRYARPHRRTIFGIFDQKPTRDLREPLHDPGMRQMLELERRIHLVARLPHPEKLASAFNSFIIAKQKAKQPIVDFQIARLLQTFKTLEDDDTNRLPEGQTWWLSLEDLRRALQALASVPENNLSSLHNELARRVYKRIETSPNQSPDAQNSELAQLLQLFCRTGESQAARDVLHAKFKESSGRSQHMEDLARVWSNIVAGFTRESKESEILRTLDIMEECAVPITSQIRATLALHYARTDNVEQTKRWFDPEFLRGDGDETKALLKAAETHRFILEFCLRNQQMEWAQQVFGNADQSWNRRAILQAAVSTGKSVDELDRMLSVMVSREGESALDIATFNDLIEYAARQKDPYTAERYFSLAQKWRAVPNAQSYILQISYRLDAEDFAGAEAAYSRLRDKPITEQEDWSIMNKMVQVFTKTSSISSDVVMGLVKDLSARKKLFPASTVAALCSYHLHRDEYFELVDLLQTYAYQYNIAERIRLRDLLAQAALDPTQDTARAWDTYMIFHQVFNLETTRDLRAAVMADMFKRKRPDLATHVFTSMARHSRADTRPDHSTYVTALMGIYHTAESEALEVVHNILKLDTEVEPSTQLRTALMLAYTACGAPWRALEFWEEISVSEEGPSYSSLHAAMRACERQPFGYRTANAIWDRLMRSDVEIDTKLFASYVGVLSGNHLFEECGTLIGHMPQTTGQQVDAYTVATFYNCARGVTYQERIAMWAQDNFPKIWDELEARGLDEDEQGFRSIRGINRDVVL